MLKTSEISHSYKGSQSFNFPDIYCPARETLLILGQSGVGKTTLLHILGGILPPKKGSVSINDTSIYDLPGNKRDKFRGKQIGIVFQKPYFVQSLNATENLMLAQKMAGLTPDKSWIKELLDNLRLSHRAASMTFTMSQGEQQRLSIARAVINKPSLILADEPSSALDDINCKQLIELLDKQALELNASLVIVTHDNRLKQYHSNQIELNAYEPD